MKSVSERLIKVDNVKVVSGECVWYTECVFRAGHRQCVKFHVSVQLKRI